jgi:hypothetical protein
VVLTTVPIFCPLALTVGCGGFVSGFAAAARFASLFSARFS